MTSLSRQAKLLSFTSSPREPDPRFPMNQNHSLSFPRHGQSVCLQRPWLGDELPAEFPSKFKYPKTPVKMPC